MSRMLFVNLPVAKLATSVDFFTKLGFSFNPDFTDEQTTCMLVGDGAFVMLLEHERFASFTKKAIADAGAAEAILTISADSREEVDQLVATALANGGAKANEPQDHGFMYGSSFYDPDGHHWEVMWMDPSAAG